MNFFLFFSELRFCLLEIVFRAFFCNNKKPRMSSVVRNEIIGSISHLIGADDGNDDDSEALNGGGVVDSDDDDGAAELGDIVCEDLENFFTNNDVDDYEKISDDEDNNNDDTNNPQQQQAEDERDIDFGGVGNEMLSLPPPGTSASIYAKDLKILEHVKRSRPKYDGSQLLVPIKKRKTFNSRYNIAAPLDRIRGPLYNSTDWIHKRGAASLAFDEDARARQIILGLVIPNSSAVPPPRGMRRIVVPPHSLTDVRFEKWMMDTTPEIYGINTVTTFHFGTPVSLHRIAQRLLGSAYSPLSFSALKIRDWLATYMIFLSGRVVCAGANNRLASFIACQSLVTLLKRCDMMVECLNFSEQNDVSTASAGFNINLIELARAYPIHVYYEPRCFPGAMMRFMSSQLVFIIFTGKETDTGNSGGKCIITGVASRLDALVAWRWVHSNILWHFELKTEKFYYNEADYSRKERQRDSVIDSVCQSICEVTQACVASIINDSIINVGDADDGIDNNDRKSVLESIYADHLDPIKKEPCVLVVDDDDNADNDNDDNDVDDKIPVVNIEPGLKDEHPALKDAHPYFRRIVSLCTSIGANGAARESPKKTKLPEIIDVEKWFENDDEVFETTLSAVKQEKLTL